MKQAVKQANFLLPEQLITNLKKSVPPRELSRFVTEALRNELKRAGLKRSLLSGFGSWKDKDHPELERGTDAYIRGLRRSSRAGRTR